MNVEPALNDLFTFWSELALKALHLFISLEHWRDAQSQGDVWWHQLTEKVKERFTIYLQIKQDVDTKVWFEKIFSPPWNLMLANVSQSKK